MNLERRSLRFLTKIIIHMIINVNNKIAATNIGIGKIIINFEIVSVLTAAVTVQVVLKKPKYGVSSQTSDIVSSVSGITDTSPLVPVVR